MSRPAKTSETKPASQAVPPVTFDVNDPALQAIIAQAVAVRLAAQQAEQAAAKSSAKSDRSVENETAVIRAFKRAGFGVVKPHEDVRTFNIWAAAGFRPKEGSKSVKVKNLRLFHRSQCRPITLEEKARAVEQAKAAIDCHTGTVVPMTGAHPQ